MRSRRCKIAVTVILIVVAIGLVGFGISVYQAVLNAMHDVYVPASAADLVIQHMKANNGAWPRSWEELHKTFSSVQEHDGKFRGFRWEEYPRRVGIDFTADPAALTTAREKHGEPPFHVIWSLAHPDANTVVDPNTRLLRYLKEQERKPASNRVGGGISAPAPHATEHAGPHLADQPGG